MHVHQEPGTQQLLIKNLLEACRRGKLWQLIRLLREDITIQHHLSEGHPSITLFGIGQCSKFLEQISRQDLQLSFPPTHSTAVLHQPGQSHPFATLSLEERDGRISRIYFQKA